MINDFKYKAIVDWAKADIKRRALVSGDRFYSENELCALHNVSRQTVRQALDMLQSEGVIIRKRGLGTFVKLSQGAAGQGVSVGVVSTYFSDYIFPSILTGIDKVLKQRGAVMRVAITENQVSLEARALEAMLGGDIKGLVIEPSKSALPNPNGELFSKLESWGIPVVFFNAKYPWSAAPCVMMDDVAAGQAAAEHLFSLGHEKISGIFALDDIQGHKRYEGFMRAFSAHGREDAEKSVLFYSTNERKTLFSQSRERIEALVSSSTAIVCYNDDIAVRLLEFCREKGVAVPEELSVTGIDDSKLSRVCSPPLTTVRHPHELLGERAAELLLDIMENGGKRADVLFAPELIIRDSTGAPKAREEK